MPTVRQLLEEAVTKLRDAGVETPILDAEVMLAHVLDRSRTDLLTHPELQPAPEAVAQSQQWIARRSLREPLSYITGEREFYGLTFEVTPAVLIPRQETEILVEAALSVLQKLETPMVADIGLGSGCVAVAIAVSLPTALIYGTESSPEALAVARRNAERLGVADRVRFLEGDLLSPVSRMRFDMIVSNPPYIPSGEFECLQPEVSKYEPREALHGGPDGLDVHRRLAAESPAYLKPGGSIAVEVGVGQSRTVEAMLQENGFGNVRFVQDYAGIERVVIGERP